MFYFVETPTSVANFTRHTLNIMGRGISRTLGNTMTWEKLLKIPQVCSLAGFSLGSDKRQASMRIEYSSPASLYTEKKTKMSVWEI